MYTNEILHIISKNVHDQCVFTKLTRVNTLILLMISTTETCRLNSGYLYRSNRYQEEP